MNSLKVALEGSSFVGKSTLGKLLAERLSTKLVQDYGCWQLPLFPPPDEAEARAGIDYLLDIERWYRSLQTSSDAVLLDRSPWSLIGFHQVVSTLFPDIPTAARYCTRRVCELAQAGEIFLPDVLIIIEPPTEEVFDERVKTRGVIQGLDFLNNYHTAVVHHIYYGKVLQAFYNYEPQQPWGITLTSRQNNPEISVNAAHNFILECQHRPESLLQQHRENVIQALKVELTPI